VKGRPPPQPSDTEPERPDAPPVIEEPAVPDPVDTWGIQSFPASDPPSWWAGGPD